MSPPCVCDEQDNNCDSVVDEGLVVTFYADLDHDGYGDSTSSIDACEAPSLYVADDTDCDDTEVATFPDATETCEGHDRDCDGHTRVGWDYDSDGDGVNNCDDASVYLETFDADEWTDESSWTDLSLFEGWPHDWSSTDTRVSGGNVPNWYATTDGALYEGSNAARGFAMTPDLGPLESWSATVDIYNGISANNDSGVVFGG